MLLAMYYNGLSATPTRMVASAPLIDRAARTDDDGLSRPPPFCLGVTLAIGSSPSD